MNLKRRTLILLSMFVLSIIVGSVCFFVHQKRPMVSVVMPTYNRADLLPLSIESILSQTYSDFEFIIVDDGSTDESWRLLKSYAQKDKRIRLYKNKKNRGISYSRNRGNDAARGKYIMLMDSDDISLPKRMEKHVAFMESHPDVVLSTSLLKSMQGDIDLKAPMAAQEPGLIFESVIGHGQWFLRRDFINQNNLKYDESQMAAEDYDFVRQIAVHRGKIGYIDEVLYLYRSHQTNSPEYYRQQKIKAQMNSFRFLLNYGVPEEMILRNNMCEIFEFVAVANKTKKYLNQAELDKVVGRCRQLSASQNNNN